jgi:hypothetical protein
MHHPWWFRYPPFPFLSPDPPNKAQAGSTTLPWYSFASNPGAGLFLFESNAATVGVVGQSGSGSNVAGQGVSIVAGSGTGTGDGGSVTLKVSPPSTSSGSSANTPLTGLSISGSTGAVSLGGIDAPSPGATAFAAADVVAGVTDTAGAALSIIGSRGTGTGDGGTVSIFVAPPSTTGSTQNAIQTGLSIDGSNGAVQLGGIDILGTPGGVTVAGSDRLAGVTDGSGAALTLQGGRPTGAGNGGDVTIRVATPGATGTTQATVQDIGRFRGSDGAVVIGNVSLVSGNTPTSQYRGVAAAAGRTDTAGGPVTVIGGLSTGTGNGGSVSLQVSPASSSSGTTQNSVQTGVSVNGGNGAITTGGIDVQGAPGASTYAGADRASGVTNGTGADVTIRSGQGTGSAAGGDLVFQVPTPTSSGTTQNSAVTIATFSGSTGQYTIGGLDLNSSSNPGAGNIRGNDAAAGRTNVVGGALNLIGGIGTGTGNGGSIVLQVAHPDASGTTQNALLTIGTFSGTNGSIALGGIDAPTGTPQASSFQGVDAATGRTDIAGGAVNVSGGQGTGTGAGGSVNLQVASPGTTGTSQNALTTRLTADTVGVVVPSGQWLREPSSRFRVSSAFSKAANTTLATVTGLSATVLAGRTYNFKAVLFVDADATGGSKYAINGTATATAIIYHVRLIDDGTSAFTISSRETALAGSAEEAGTTVGLAIIEGTITVNAAGTLTVEFAQSVANGTSTVLVGSTFVVTDLGA